MKKHILLNAFDMNCVGHIQHGMWTHPRDTATGYNRLDYWVNLARTLERGLFDGLFIADIIGVYDVFRGSADASLRAAVQVPVNDPLMLVSAMAYATRNLGFGVTCNTTYEQPYSFARRFSTLDHLTNGRIGWNIVTGYLDSGARAMGLDRQLDHDTRYDIADEFMEVAYKLWEGSWEDDAVRADKAGRVYTDPAKVHAVHHHGENYRLDAIHMSEPSPQRTPVLYQAGASGRGRRFAATHAECVFLNNSSKAGTGDLVADTRRQAASQGRDPNDIKAFVHAAIVVGRTDAEAREKLADYSAYASTDGALAHLSAAMGIDLAAYDPDEPITYVKTDANNSQVEAYTVRADTVWTVRKLTGLMGLGSRYPPIVGSPQTVADEMMAWMEQADIDGFNLSRTVMPECVEDFVALVVPELQSRGVYKTEYAPGTLRQKLYGPGRARLPASHPAARWRR
jgi:FMN-dependent oxidoreductase (nitrilotriacetate monooxygenase family)